MSDTSEIVTLTVDEARELVEQYPEGICLDGLTDLPVEVAEELAKIYGDLLLNGLTKLSAEATEVLALSDAVKRLELNGLLDLQPGVAKAISKFGSRGDHPLQFLYLGLDGLDSLADDHAWQLAKYEGQLSLGGLKHISEEEAHILARHEGDLFLNGLVAVTPEVAGALAKHVGTLGLDGVASITEEVAEKFLQHEHSLSLNGLKSLPIELATKISKCKSWLSLNGLAEISDSVAAVFAQRRHTGTDLEGVVAISKETLVALRSNPNINLPEDLIPS